MEAKNSKNLIRCFAICVEDHQNQNVTYQGKVVQQ
jgi:hypothetical protein